jgi:hypothetical protein
MFLVFVFPPAPLMLVFLGLLLLIPALIGSKIFDAIDRAMVRQFIGRNVCPNCRNVSEGPPRGETDWSCSHCHAAYQRSGAAPMLAESPAP